MPGIVFEVDVFFEVASDSLVDETEEECDVETCVAATEDDTESAFIFAVAPDEGIVVFISFVVADEVEREALGNVAQVEEEDIAIDNGDCVIAFGVFTNVFVLRKINGEGIPEIKLVIDVFRGRVAALFKVVLEEFKRFGLFVVAAELALVEACT